MAVLQSRVIALIEAALDYQHAFEELTRLIHKEDQNIRLGNQTPEGAILNLIIAADERILLKDPNNTKHIITAEHYHFTRNARRNIKEREYQAKRREAQGILPTKTHFIPHYAKEEFSESNQQLTPFRAEGQNIRGDIPNIIPRSLTPEARWEIDNRPPPTDLTLEEENEYKAFIQRRDEEAKRRKQDPFQTSEGESK